ncbi:immunity 52 family protein [Pyxidicoccus parkwayensis]|uniref:Immunity 52 family protein n=1 Tax=Pyxidicoccus parkwayensis TaxID=2813578 RepID=A0ABX7NT29_9BACT|nr:immunity 52 family protein [Pyxidicoccus parkwaysis]QSQ21628.1 immunity 52 family protein [Pyxidicoccus parkwaysis]
MSETYFAGTYWGPRKEPPEECARRMEVFLAGLRDVDPLFVRWFQPGKSRKDALKRLIEPNRKELTRLVLRGKDRAFEDLGFRISGWNGAGDDDEATGFDVHCGGYTNVVRNTCVFTLPGREPNADRVLTAPVLAGLLRVSAIAWEPNWGIATSHAHRGLIDARSIKGAPRVGWVTYLARHLGTVPPLPAPVRIERVEDRGTLITLTPERFTVDNPEHVALAEQVRELLDGAGLLKPAQPQS